MTDTTCRCAAATDSKLHCVCDLLADIAAKEAARPEAKLIADYADLQVSCGYIGNLDMQFRIDDRKFMVFTKVVDPRGINHGCMALHVVSVPYNCKEFPWSGASKVQYDTPAVREWLDEIRAEVAAGKLHVYQDR